MVYSCKLHGYQKLALTNFFSGTAWTITLPMDSHVSDSDNDKTSMSCSINTESSGSECNVHGELNASINIGTLLS